MYSMVAPEVPLRSLRTRLVQRTTRSLGKVNAVFNAEGRSGHEVCLVVVPDGTALCCCCQLLVEVPSGPWALWHEFGAYMGAATAGAKWCLPVWKGVSHFVTKQVITFNAMPKSCPTRDTVFVDVDLSINFRIGPDLERVSIFVFKMGAERLDAYLNLQIEECLRTLVYGVTHDRVNDLRSEFSSEMLRVLQSKASRFGVDVLNVKITDVQLPQELQVRLERTTGFKTRLQEEHKNHEHVLQQIDNSSAQIAAEIKQKFTIDGSRLRATAERYEIEMDENKANAKSDRNVQMENAKGQMEVALLKCRGEVDVAAYEARTAKVDLVQSTTIKCEAELREMQNQCMVACKHAEAHKDASALLAAARLAEAEAQGLVAVNTTNKTIFDQQIRLSQIDAQLAASGRKVISGTQGDNILASFVSVRADLMDRR